MKEIVKFFSSSRPLLKLEQKWQVFCKSFVNTATFIEVAMATVHTRSRSCRKFEFMVEMSKAKCI